MNREQFIKIISLIQNFESEQQTLKVLIDKITDGYSIVTIGDYLIAEIIDMINEALKIKDKELISWWLYESVDKVIEYKNAGDVKYKKVSVRTVENLYDYIIKNEYKCPQT